MSLRTTMATILGLGLIAVPSEAARACPFAGAMTPYLHRSLPPMAQGMIAAEVEIVGDRGAGGDVAIEARVVAMLRGDFSGTTMRIEPQFVTSCDAFPRIGDKGVLVGRPVSTANGVLVVDPVRAPSGWELERYRVPRPKGR
jgi:hypothetical protein